MLLLLLWLSDIRTPCSTTGLWPDGVSSPYQIVIHTHSTPFAMLTLNRLARAPAVGVGAGAAAGEGEGAA
jgi:hypothetical protein